MANGRQALDGPDGWSLPRGRILLRALRSEPLQEYLLCVPRSAKRGGQVLVSVHGISRNALRQASVLAPLCERRGVVLLVPIFGDDRHRDYQRLGRKGRGSRVDRLLHRFLAEVASLTGADVTRILLFGFSAGAQFAHRYLMAHPHRVSRVAIAAAGWYTMPSNQRRFPYGIRPHRSLEGVSFNPEAFLRVPVEVLIGQNDTGSKNVRRTERLDAQQGTTRLERARNWVQAMREAAEAHGLDPCVSLTEVPGIDHSFEAFCEAGGLVDRVDEALFGAPPDRATAVALGRSPAATRTASRGAPAEAGL